LRLEDVWAGLVLHLPAPLALALDEYRLCWKNLFDKPMLNFLIQHFYIFMSGFPGVFLDADFLCAHLSSPALAKFCAL